MIKLKKAFNAYEYRSNSYGTKNKKISEALELYDKRRKYNAEDELKKLSEQINQEAEAYNSSVSNPIKHGYGKTAAKDVLESHRQNTLNLNQYRKTVEAYSDIIGGKKADELMLSQRLAINFVNFMLNPSQEQTRTSTMP